MTRTMCSVSLALLLAAGVALAASPPTAGPLALGSKAPMLDAPLQNVDGKEVTIGGVRGPKGTLVIFTCNACPYAKAWEERIVQLGNEYRQKGIGVIAINPNDPKVVAEDDFPTMQARAKARGMAFPYAVDATSDVARAYGATRTPEAFLFDASGTLVYHGAVDDSGEAAKVKDRYLEDALKAVLAGSDVPVKDTKAIGCGIKFRNKA